MSVPTASDDARPVRWSFEDVLAAGAMAVLVLITMANVLVRYFSDISFAWTEEVSVYFMVLMAFAGAAGAIRRNSHIRMDLLSKRGPARWQRAALQVGLAASAVAFGVLALLLLRTALDEFRFNELSSLNLPRWWITLPEALLALLVALRATAALVATGRSAP